MKTLVRMVVFLAAVQLVFAQRGGGAPAGAGGSMSPISRSQADYMQRTYTVNGKVQNMRRDPIRGAKVVIRVTKMAGVIRELHTDAGGEFSTQVTLSQESDESFGVDLNADKHGYMPAQEIVDFGNSGKTWKLTITLRDLHEDANLLFLEDLIAGLAPRLKELSSADGLSEKSAKDYEHGVKEFLNEGNPVGAVSNFARVAGRNPSCAACRTMWGLAQLAMNDWDGAERSFDEAVKTIRGDPGKARPEPDIALGVMETWRHDMERGAEFFYEAVKFAPQDPLALQELGRTQLALEKWEEASDQLQQAVAAGAGRDAHLMYAEALLHLDHFREADRELTTYLAGRDVKTMAPKIRQLWQEIQTQEREELASTGGIFSMDRSTDELIQTIAELKGLEPAADQRPLASILDETGKRVADSFRDFPNTVSVEQVHQEKLQRRGKIEGSQDQEFHYLWLMQPDPTGPGITEYRADKTGGVAAQKGLEDGYMLTSGFTSAALYFHPFYRGEARFRYLGRQKSDGRDFYVVAFAQYPGKARVAGGFRVNGVPKSTYFQGLAWIDAGNYEIVRLRQDLLTPLPEIRLERQTTEINFGAVRFKNLTEEFWLPQRVSVAVDWGGKRLRNEHRYSNFELFNVSAAENDGQRRSPVTPASKIEAGPGTP
ncbi:MAG: CDC27 family protein [Terriglobia bacterium]